MASRMSKPDRSRRCPVSIEEQTGGNEGGGLQTLRQKGPYSMIQLQGEPESPSFPSPIMAASKRQRSGYQAYLTYSSANHQRRLNYGLYFPSTSRITNSSNPSDTDSHLSSSGDGFAGGGDTESPDEETCQNNHQRLSHNEPRATGRLRNDIGHPLPTDEEAEEIYEQLWNPDGIALGEAIQIRDSRNHSPGSLHSSACHFPCCASLMPGSFRACWASLRAKMTGKWKALFRHDHHRSCHRKHDARPHSTQSHRRSRSRSSKKCDSVAALCCFPLDKDNSTASLPFPMRRRRRPMSSPPAPQSHDEPPSLSDDSKQSLNTISKSEDKHNRRRDSRRAERRELFEGAQREPPFWSQYGRTYS